MTISVGTKQNGGVLRAVEIDEKESRMREDAEAAASPVTGVDSHRKSMLIE
jgi:hypothetical protein